MIRIFSTTSSPQKPSWIGDLEEAVNIFCARNDIEVTAITLTQSDAPPSHERMTVLVRYIPLQTTEPQEIEPQPGMTRVVPAPNGYRVERYGDGRWELVGIYPSRAFADQMAQDMAR